MRTLLIPSDELLSGVARKRLAAIRDFSDLGTGFRVAALDLEIRGAGNLLGGEQHGHIDAVGFDLYCRLLQQTVEELQGQTAADEISTSINLNLDIRIPEDYVADSSQRLRMYKRISSAANSEELENLRQEMVDRFGKYPEPVENLFRYARLRQDALALEIQSIERRDHHVYFRFVDQSKVNPQQLLTLVTRNKRATFSPQGVLGLEVQDLSSCGPVPVYSPGPGPDPDLRRYEKTGPAVQNECRAFGPRFWRGRENPALGGRCSSRGKSRSKLRQHWRGPKARADIIATPVRGVVRDTNWIEGRRSGTRPALRPQFFHNL